METTVAAPVSPQTQNISTQSPKKHYIRTFSNSNLNPPSPKHQGYRRDGRNNQNHPKVQNRSENEHNCNNAGKSNEESRQASVHNNQAANGWWRRTQDDINAENKRKVVVTGYPTYTNIQEIVKLLSQFGEVQVDRGNKVVTVLLYRTEEEAQAAILASDQIVIYGKLLKIKKFTSEKHVDDISRSARRTKNTVEDDIIQPKEIDLSGDFYQQLDNIQAAIRLTAEEINAISTLYRDVEALLQPLYPGCRAIPFGSITTGLGIKTSDADCFVEMPARFVGGGHDVRFVSAARRVLAARPKLFADVVAIPGANTPIVKFRHLPTGTRCDLNCKTPLGALNSRLVAALLGHDARLPPLALLLKYWARVHRLSGTGRLTNYALVLLLVFYLQARRVLPPVAALQPPRAARPVDHWDAGFAPDALPPPADATPLPHLLGDFFRFYATFDFDSLVVCPYLGAPVLKAAFEGGAAPPGLERYADNVARRLAGPLRHSSPLCVQDPIEQSHNVATGVSANLAGELRRHIRHAAARYEAALPTCRALLPALLLTAPPPPPPRATPLRVRVPPYAVRALPGDWRALLRHLVLDRIFGEMLALPLAPCDAAGTDEDADLDADADPASVGANEANPKGKSDDSPSEPERETGSTTDSLSKDSEASPKITSKTEDETEAATAEDSKRTGEGAFGRKSVPRETTDAAATTETRAEKEIPANVESGAKKAPDGRAKRAEGAAARAREVYAGRSARVTWRRRVLGACGVTAAELLAREARAAAQLLRSGPELAEPLRFQLELVFGEQPRSLVVVARPLTGDAEAFRAFGTCVRASLHSWLLALLEPHQPGPQPHQPGPQPHQPGPQPHQPGPQPHQPGQQPHQQCPQPHQPGPQPHQPGPQPRKPGPQPHQPGPQPHQPGQQPHQQCPQPHQPGPQPHQPGPQPHQPGPQPHQPDPQPHQPGPQPHQPGPQPRKPGSQPHQPDPQPPPQRPSPQAAPTPSD